MKKGRHLTICSVLRVMFHIKIRLRQEETNLQTSTTTESCLPSLPFNNKRQLLRVQEQSGAPGEPPEVPPPRGHRAAAARGQAHRLRHPEAGGGCLHV